MFGSQVWEAKVVFDPNTEAMLRDLPEDSEQRRWDAIGSLFKDHYVLC